MSEATTRETQQHHRELYTTYYVAHSCCKHGAVLHDYCAMFVAPSMGSTLVLALLVSHRPLTDLADMVAFPEMLQYPFWMCVTASADSSLRYRNAPAIQYTVTD